MPSKKLPNRVEGLFDATRSIVKDGRRPAFAATLRPVEAPPALPADLEVPQAMAGWTWEIDAAGSYVFCSAEVENLLGYLPQELHGQTLASLNGRQPHNGEPLLSDILRAAQPFNDVRWLAQRKDGSAVLLVMSGYPIRNEDGHLTGYHGITYLAGTAEPREALPPVTPVTPVTPAVAAVAAPAQEPAPVAELPVALPQPEWPVETAAGVEAPGDQPLTPVLAEPDEALPVHMVANLSYLDGPEGLAPIEPGHLPPEIGEAIAEGQLIQKINDPLTAREGEEHHTGRSLATPIKIQEQILGALDFFDPDKTQAWSEDDLALAQTVADQLGLALENARLFNETRIQQRNATYLARATQAVGRTLNETELWGVLADELVVAYHPQHVLISHWDPMANTLTPVATRGRNSQRGAELGVTQTLAGQRPEVAQVLQNRQGQIIPPAPRPNGASLATLLHPLIFNDVVECLVEVSADRPEGFTPDDLRLLGSALFAAGSALRTVRLYDLQRQTAERLTEMDKVKSQFLANMSHELRTPLNSIIGFSRVILKGIDGPLTEQQTQDLTSIYNSGRHLLELINDILDSSKIEAGKMEMVFEEVDLHEIIKGVMSTGVGLVKDKPTIVLKEEIADPLPTVNADATRVRQVLINLMSNASKFTDTGSITLRARPIEERDPRTNLMARYVQLSVLDTGTGIAEQDMHKLFEAFSQVDSSPTRKVGGTGLGLSICRRMIELHGGRIWAESQEGQGSTFSFILPLYQKEPPPAPPANGQAAAPTVMVVEDDQGIVGLYRRYLEPHGYSLLCIDKSADALASAAEHQPVAILLDVIMPQRDGWRVLADLKQNEQTRNIPVVICTIVSDRERAMNMGAADYLNKPILEADLLQALEKVAPAVRLPAPAGGGAGR
jgi:PAS domain S-box-containing protein